MNPANFDHEGLDALLAETLGVLHGLGAGALVVLGPDPLADPPTRSLLAVHPPRLHGAARALAESPEYGPGWEASDAPLVVWSELAKFDPAANEVARWRRLWLAHGFVSLVRVAFALPAGQAFECFLFGPQRLGGRAQAAELAWAMTSMWPALRQALASARVDLSPRERECLRLTFEGLTAREAAARAGCSERTVNYHLANAMTKLKTDSKLHAVRRACWLGLL